MSIETSHWEADAFAERGTVIVGGGIVGLSTAASILEREPKADVLVLERGLLPSGASTRNAGFACFGSLTEILADLETMTAEEAAELVALRWDGLNKLRSRLGDAAIGYEAKGGYEIVSEKELPALARMEEVNDLLAPLFGKAVYERQDEKIAAFGFRPEYARALALNRFEGQLHTGRMMRALIRHVQRLGGEVLTGARVVGYDERADRVEVTVERGPTGEPFVFMADRLAFCTNAFTDRLLPQVDYAPGRGLCLITKPLARVPFNGAFHIDEGYYYFRDVGERVLFGGGRNLDIEGERTQAFGRNEAIYQELLLRLRRDVLPGTPFEIERDWSGVMAFGPSKQPVVQRVSDRVSVGVRLGGMGVAVGSALGERLVETMNRTSKPPFPLTMSERPQ